MNPWESDNKIYTGIGSRKTPPNILAMMAKIAHCLDENGFTLRSGGAEGADTAFDKWSLNKRLYLPWQGWNGRYSHMERPSEAAFEVASKLHPAWDKLSYTHRALHARNVHQVMGDDLNTPSSFVLCWTPDGATGSTTYHTGGTGQAIRTASAYRVPVYNLCKKEHRELFAPLISDLHINNGKLAQQIMSWAKV